MPDYAKKAEVIRSGLCVTEKQVSRAFYAQMLLDTTGEYIYSEMDTQRADELQLYHRMFNLENWQEAHRINKASYARVKRLKTRIASMLKNGECLFLTLTFTDETLGKTTEDTRRQAVRRYLKSFGVPYVANIDYGKKNGREHYHAVIQTDHVDYNGYTYGAINGERIRSVEDYVKLSKYVAKLTNHAIKQTNKRQVIIYSK